MSALTILVRFESLFLYDRTFKVFVSSTIVKSFGDMNAIQTTTFECVLDFGTAR